MYELAGFLYSLISAIVSIFLLNKALEKKSEELFIFSLLFIIISWSGIEWTLWLYGKNLFDMVFAPIVPLLSYFVAWCILIIYLSERYFKRRDWIIFLLAVAVITTVAVNCMNCLFS